MLHLILQTKEVELFVQKRESGVNQLCVEPFVIFLVKSLRPRLSMMVQCHLSAKNSFVLHVVFTSLPLLLLPRHGINVYEGEFLKAFLILFQLVKLSLKNTTQLEEDTPSGGAFATVDMPVHDDGHGLLLEVDRHVQPIKNPIHLSVTSTFVSQVMITRLNYPAVGYMPPSVLDMCSQHLVCSGASIILLQDQPNQSKLSSGA